MKELLKELKACKEAVEWANDKSWEEIYTTCHRGDWLLWLFKKTMEDNEANLRLLTLAKGHCAATVLHLMKDKRSINAVKVAIAFGEGKATKKELDAASDAAYAAYAAAYAAASAASAAAYATSYAAYAAADAASNAYAAADAASNAYAAADAAYAAASRTKNQKETADICRKYLPKEVWNIGGNK